MAALLDERIARLALGEADIARLTASLSNDDREAIEPLLSIAAMLRSRVLVQALNS
jgi:hypothetical protein